MGCEIDFFNGDFTSLESFSGHEPVLFWVLPSSDIGNCFNLYSFTYDKPVKLSKEDISLIKEHLSELLSSTEKYLAEREEIKSILMKTIPLKEEDYYDFQDRLSEIKNEIEELNEIQQLIYESFGVLKVFVNMLDSNCIITVLKG